MSMAVLLGSIRMTAPALGILLALHVLNGTRAQAQPLPGDNIFGFRVIAIREDPSSYWDWEMRLEVSYSYRVEHGRAIVGAELGPPSPEFKSGHSYWGTESGPDRAVNEERYGEIVRGMQRVRVAIHLDAPQATTHLLRLYLYHPQGGEFLQRVFDYRRFWTKPFGLPDLVIIDGSQNPPNPVPPGTQVRFALRVMNRGSAPAGGYVRVVGPGNYGGGFGGGLQPGEIKVALVAYPVYSRGAVYRLRFTVDPDNVIAESNEANNTSGEFIVQTGW